MLGFIEHHGSTDIQFFYFFNEASLHIDVLSIYHIYCVCADVLVGIMFDLRARNLYVRVGF